MSNILVYIGSAIIILWGIGHIVPTKSIVTGFGEISQDNKRIIIMEWIAEGLTLCFVGLLVLIVTVFGGYRNQTVVIVYRMAAGMLIILAGLSLMTGAKTSIVPIKICPLVKTIVAILFLLSSIL